jgi:outer membrane autotransporter protein
MLSALGHRTRGGKVSFLGTALAGQLAFVLIGLPGTAQAQTVCATPAVGGATFNCIAVSGDANATITTAATVAAGTPAVVVSAPGNATATIGGAVTASGAGSSAVLITGTTALLSVGPNGSVQATDGNSITLNSVSGSTLTNAGLIANNVQGFAVVANGGPIVINNSGSLTSDVVLTAGADRINNSGTFVVAANPDFGAGADVFANSGIVTVGSGATAAVSPSFVGLETFTNAGGTISLVNGRVGDTLTLPGTFSGTGNSRLAVDAQLGTTAGVDRLVVGGAASGSTTIQLNTVAGSASLFNAGTIVVQAGAASAASAFQLDGGFVEQGLVRYELAYNPADFSFRLTGAPSDAAFQMVSFVEGARSLWQKSADTVSGQLRGQRDHLWAQGGGEPSPRMWLQIHGSIEEREGGRAVSNFGQSRTVDTGFQQDYFGGQAGLDLGGGSGERGGFAVGVTGGYINSTMHFAGANRLNYDAANAGVYASYTSGNVFANVLGKYDWYWANLQDQTAGIQQSFKGHSYGARGEVGLRFGSDSFFVEPAASLSYVKTRLDNFTVLGTQVAFDEDDGLRGRAGARLGGQFNVLGSKGAFYLGGNYVREFKSRDGVTFTGGGQTFTFQNTRPREYGEGLVGLSIGQANGVSGFMEATYTRSFKDDSAGRLPIEGAGGRAGLRVRF